MTRWLGLAAALLVLGVSGEARAFCRTTTCDPDERDCQVDENNCATIGEPLRWRRLPIVYRFSATRPGLLIREEARAAVRAAFYRWSDTLCGPEQRRTSLRFEEGEDIPTDKPLEPKSRGSEPFGVYFRDRGWPYTEKTDSALAQTNTLFGVNSGFIQYADIEINTSANRFSTKEDEEDGLDLQTVVTHEVGHYIGLAHSTAPNSIMVSSLCESEGRCEKGKVAARRLAEDDLIAVCELYPPGEPPETPPPAEPAKSAGCGTTPSEGIEPAAGLGLVAALAVALSRRRRR